MAKGLYTVADSGKILGLGINGPLSQPTEMEDYDVSAMVRAGRKIYQHNPYRKNDKVLLTVDNMGTIRFTPAVRKVVKEEVSEVDQNRVVERTDLNQPNQNVGGYNKKNKHKNKHKNNNGVFNDQTPETVIRSETVDTPPEEVEPNVPLVSVDETKPVLVGDAFENVNANANM